MRSDYFKSKLMVLFNISSMKNKLLFAKRWFERMKIYRRCAWQHHVCSAC